eukprot:scpid92012/ scgid28835/ 
MFSRFATMAKVRSSWFCCAASLNMSASTVSNHGCMSAMNSGESNGLPAAAGTFSSSILLQLCAEITRCRLSYTAAREDFFPGFSTAKCGVALQRRSTPETRLNDWIVGRYGADRVKPDAKVFSVITREMLNYSFKDQNNDPSLIPSCSHSQAGA